MMSPIAEPGGDQPVPPLEPTASSAGELDRLRSEAARLRDQAEEYLDLARRQKADFANYQGRIARERTEWKREAVEEFLRDFLPALDAFTLARFQEPALMESMRLVE